jgi:hypothetical protein
LPAFANLPRQSLRIANGLTVRQLRATAKQVEKAAGAVE